ncbi:hypothetical protein DPEC_G00111280 [Dallia pectoralis]|uniref:Uncharacterized protein n=1 Tax=Dallia pectoralis TaxID=75939 RepID=A0ACC2GT99_DALPE|nr:hypothetical protein DPEC_G00111280 [Dallia pectoralis]
MTVAFLPHSVPRVKNTAKRKSTKTHFQELSRNRVTCRFEKDTRVPSQEVRHQEAFHYPCCDPEGEENGSDRHTGLPCEHS